MNSTVTGKQGGQFDSPAEAAAKLFDCIEVFYIQIRMDSSLDYASAAEVEGAAAQISEVA